jgi:hypothetical protein
LVRVFERRWQEIAAARKGAGSDKAGNGETTEKTVAPGTS